MALLTEDEILGRAAQVPHLLRKSVASVLVEHAAADRDERFDVFLSHSSNESADILLGVYETLTDLKLRVYVDSYSDPQLDPDNVDRTTAEILRHRLRSSASLLYVHSRYSSRSRWMPWELGFADAHSGKVGIMPIVRGSAGVFRGEEFLSLYPYVDIQMIAGKTDRILWINRSARAYAPLDRWVRGQEAIPARS